MNLELPKKGFTKTEREWLVQLIQAIKTVRGISGRNVSISESDKGQIINAADCPQGP